MTNIHCLNNISKKGTDLLPDSYNLVDDLNEAQGILVRSAQLHDTEFPKGLLCIARAGAGVNNIPLDRCAEAGIVVFNTPPPAQTPTPSRSSYCAACCFRAAAS